MERLKESIMKLINKDTLRLQKEKIYEYYSNVIENVKPYEKITRKRMMEEVIDFYNDTQPRLLDVCNSDELHALQGLIKGEKIDIDITVIRSLQSKYLLCFSFYEDNKSIPEELKDYIEKAMLDVDWDLIEERTLLYQFIVGVIRTHGRLPISVIAQFVCLHIYEVIEDKEKTEEIIEFIKSNIYLRKYLVFEKDEQYNMQYLLYAKEYYDYWEDIQERIIEVKAYFKMRTREEYLVMGKDGLNTTDPIIKEFKEFCDTLYLWNKENLLDAIQYGVQCAYEIPMDMFQYIEELDDEIMDLVEEVVKRSFSSAFQGNSFYEYIEARKEDEEAFYEIEEQQVQQGINACLPAKEVNRFYKLLNRLLDYTNKKYNVNPKVKTFIQYDKVDSREAKVVLDYIWSHRDVIDELIQDNPYQLSRRELADIEKWKLAIVGKFTVVRHERNYTVMLDENDTYYGVKGILTPLSEMFVYPPMFCEITLLPYLDCIIYDGVCMQTPINLSIRVKKSILDKAKEAEIIRRLEIMH